MFVESQLTTAIELCNLLVTKTNLFQKVLENILFDCVTNTIESSSLGHAADIFFQTHTIYLTIKTKIHKI